MKLFQFLAFSLLLGGSVLLAQEKFHIVLKGETLFGIARQYEIDIDSLKKWNNLKDNSIYIGQNLLLEPRAQSLFTPANNLNANYPQSAIYQVKKGDSLGLIAQSFNLPINQIIAWNNLVSTDLAVGQVLVVQEPKYLLTYIAKEGDNLYSIARENNISFSELLEINKLPKDSVLKVGQKLKVSSPKESQNWHYVKESDTLGSIASIYGIKEEVIRQLNGINSKLEEGTLLEIRKVSSNIVDKASDDSSFEIISAKEKDSSSDTHTVTGGDTLYSIASRYNILIEDLKSLNNLKSNSIYKGQVLTLPSNKKSEGIFKEEKEILVSSVVNKNDITLPSEAQVESNKTTKVNLPSSLSNNDTTKVGSFKSLVVFDPKIPLFEKNGDYYYWREPKMTYQPSATYFEEWNSPLDAYKKANQLFKAFEKLVESRPSKSQVLKGKTVILDPGHGGLDPGAIVKSKDGLGRDIYITEAQYVYDIALRMYVLLKDHGANVYLTILAPDHLIRDTSPASNTLVNMKNQVYNLESLNIPDTKDSWPDGSQNGLAKRVEVIKNFTQGNNKEDAIFISLHADNQPSMPRSIGILYEKNPEMNDGYSQRAAEEIQEAMGGKNKAYVKGQDLFVLRNNPLKYKVLLELRNVAWSEEAWALRFSEMRQEDAERVVRGIIAFFSSLK